MTVWPGDQHAEQPDVEILEAEAVNSAKARQSLYAARKKIFPKRASGSFRQFKWLVMAVTLGIYYLTPWLRWDRGPLRPTRRCSSIWRTAASTSSSSRSGRRNSIYVAGLLIMAGLGLFLVTSAVGRAWCGYACPQTVWVDLFLVVERWIEGDRNARIKLDAGALDRRQAVRSASPSTRPGW